MVPLNLGRRSVRTLMPRPPQQALTAFIGDILAVCRRYQHETDCLESCHPRTAVPDAHRRAADRFRKLCRPVPLTEVEQIPDPDFGL